MGWRENYRLKISSLSQLNAFGREQQWCSGDVLMESNILCVWKGVLKFPWLVWLWQNSIVHSEGNCWIIKFKLLHRSQMERNEIITLSPREGRLRMKRECARISCVFQWNCYFQILYSLCLWEVGKNRLNLNLQCLDVFKCQSVVECWIRST